MKELPIEEKAKAYDEALKILHKYDGANIMFSQSLKEEMFPELKESEDERIRKDIITHFKAQQERLSTTSNAFTSYPSWIAWLKKQGEKTEPIEGFNTEFERQISHLIASIINNEYSYNKAFVKWASGALLNYAKHEFEKQGEQKPADKIEPKFKVGDWVVNKFGDAWHIDSFDKKNYQVSNGDKYNYFPISKENEMHLWTIQDAKDGDVLVRDIYPSGPSIYIFKEFIRQIFTMKVHCSINNKGQFLHNHDVYYYRYDATLYPATKEQRDLLFQKIKEAGYDWDAGKRELKKIEQTSANEIPYPETLEKAIDLYYYSYGNGEGEFEHLSLEKFRDIVHTFVSDYGQKPAVWTEEDEKFFKTALWHISNSISNGKSTDIHCDTTDWFKSLKDRLQAQKGK